MGYHLNELVNLPLDDRVNFYIFLINGQYREPLYQMIEENFVHIARSIGSNAVVAVGTEPRGFSTSVARIILGQGNSDASFLAMLPALILTDGHPDQLTPESLRLVVPLRDAKPLFGEWHQFFDSLAAFARGESDDFLEKFQKKESFLDAANDIVHLKPNFFGVGLNINALLGRLGKPKPGNA